MLTHQLRFAMLNLSANFSRGSFLTLIVGVSIAAWICLSVLASPFAQPRVTAKFGGVQVASANEGIELPIGYAKRIAAIPGARNVTYQTGALVTCKDRVPVSINAWGGPGVERILTEMLPHTPSSMALVSEWMNDRMGALVGTQVAEDCGWRPGMGVSPTSHFTGKSVELHILGVMPKQAEPLANSIVIAHYDYVNLTKPSYLYPNRVYGIQTSTVNLHAAPALAARIEAAFAHDYPPVVAHTSATFQNAMLRYGRAQYVLGYVMLAIFLCAALVLVSVLAHAVAQRRPQMALLQVLGYSRTTLFISFALEGIVIVLVGSGLGIGAGLLILHLLPATLGQFFAGFAIPSWTWWGLPIWLAGLLGAALVIPLATIARLRPVDVREL